MVRVKLVIAYDGTDFVGWQYQPNGVSVQQSLEQALGQLTGVVHSVHSSGRTDAGVHARGMVCHFDTDFDFPLTAWREGVNRFLPPTIAVRLAEFVDSQFHARFSAAGKLYRYTILRDEVRSPLDRLYRWQVKYDLDVALMEEAGSLFVGRHDFSGFRTSGCAAETTLREIYSLRIVERGHCLEIDVHGGGFLKNMVRMMVGTLVDVGRGKRSVNDIKLLLEKPESVKSALTAPAHGLCLLEVYY